jgi:hypothetical protein
MLGARLLFRLIMVREASEGSVKRGTFTPHTECTGIRRRVSRLLNPCCESALEMIRYGSARTAALLERKALNNGRCNAAAGKGQQPNSKEREREREREVERVSMKTFGGEHAASMDLDWSHSHNRRDGPHRAPASTAWDERAGTHTRFRHITGAAVSIIYTLFNLCPKPTSRRLGASSRGCSASMQGALFPAVCWHDHYCPCFLERKSQQSRAFPI